MQSTLLRNGFLNFLFLFGILVSGFAQTTKYAKVQGLNVRSQPGVEAESILQLDKGTEVQAFETSHSWTRIEYNGVEGYVAATYLSSTQVQQSQSKREATVLICNSSRAYAYHAYQCHGLNRCKSGISSVSVSEAKAQGYSACKICY